MTANNYYNIQNTSNNYITSPISSNGFEYTNYSANQNYTDPQILNTISPTYIYPTNSPQYISTQNYNIDTNLNAYSNIEIPGINTTTMNNDINQLANIRK